MKVIGSQHREMLKESGYKLVARWKGAVILEDTFSGQRELWYASDHHSGYTIQVGRWGYEYGSDWHDD